MAVIFRPDPDNPQPRVVTRRCPVCEWEGIVVVGSSDEEDCPQCHAPTAVPESGDTTPADAAPGGAAPEPAPRTKNPHAAALGRLGGVRGGKARAESLTAKRRKEIARNAALARWRKR